MIQARSSRRNPDLSGHERLCGAVEVAGWSVGACSCRALLESHLCVAELLDRLCPGRGPRCYCSLFEGHAELLDRWQTICNIRVLQSRLCAVELLDCIWQYASSSLLPRLKVGGGCLGRG